MTALWVGGAKINAAKFLNYQLRIIPGPVGHEIFLNECNEEGKAEFPEGLAETIHLSTAQRSIS